MEPDSTGQNPSGGFSNRRNSGQTPGSPQKLSTKSRHKPLYFRFWFWLLAGFGGGLVALSSVWLSVESTLPPADELSATVRSQTLTIAAGDGTILQQQGPATREPLKIRQIPDLLIQAFIASEDRRFYQHRGVDRQGIVRAVWANLRSANLVEGGSTITQQLARILFLNQERSLWRKLKEIRVAMKLEENLSKDQILERYLNSVYLGQGAYGVADAAWVYFSKPVNRLTLSEMATIAGLAPAPSYYSPTVNRPAAIGRRNLVLQRMQEDGVITASEAAAAKNAPLKIKASSPKRLQAKASYFTTYIQGELPKYVPADILQAGGLTVETSLNPKWQQAAEAVVLKTVAESGKWQRFEQAALVAIDPRNGEVRAMVGGTDFRKHQFNRATQAQRQPGSTFKGFVYTAAIASGLSPYKQYLDSPFKVDGYEPKNFSEKFRGDMSMRDALAASINVVAVKVLMDVGFEPTIKLAQAMGIKSPLIPAYSLALGSAEVNLLELSSAYGSLANVGMHTEAHGIRRIRDRSGNIIYDAKFKSQRVLDPDSAAIATWMLKNVVTTGTGGAAALADRSVAGKTGTSDKARDLWFVGYIPQLVTGVWLGNDNNQPTAGSSSTAAYAWNRFMVQAVEGMEVEKFAALPNLDNRKPSIKRQPVKPRRIYIGKVTERNSEGGSLRQGENSVNYQPTGRRRRRYTQQSQELRRSLWRSRLQRQTPAADPQRYNRLMDRLRQNRIPRQPTLFPSQETPIERE